MKKSLFKKLARYVNDKYPAISNGGIDVEELVSSVLSRSRALEGEWFQKNIGDDARDYANTAGYLSLLSDKALSEIYYIGAMEIRRRLRNKLYPFSGLNKKTRETLLHLPNSWIHGAADHLLKEREFGESHKPTR